MEIAMLPHNKDLQSTLCWQPYRTTTNTWLPESLGLSNHLNNKHRGPVYALFEHFFVKICDHFKTGLNSCYSNGNQTSANTSTWFRYSFNIRRFVNYSCMNYCVFRPANAWLRMVENDQKHSKMSKKVFLTEIPKLRYSPQRRISNQDPASPKFDGNWLFYLKKGGQK